MEVKINAGRSVLGSIKIVKETLGLSIKDAHDMVKAGQFECPDEMFTQLNDRLQEAGGFLEPITTTAQKDSEVSVKTTVESSLVVSEEFASFAKENPSLTENVVMGLIRSLKPGTHVYLRKKEDKFVNIVSVEIEDQKEVESAKVLAVTLNNFVVDSIKEVGNFRATFKRDFTEWYCKEDECDES